MKMGRVVIALSLLGIVARPVCAAPSFEETARQVIIAFQQQDNAKINALIDKKTGLYVMYRLGSGDAYKWSTQFDFNQPVTEMASMFMRWNTDHIPNDAEFNYRARYDYRTTASFVCEQGWDRAGVFVSYDDTILSFSMTNGSLDDESAAIDAKIAAARRLELQSKRVVVVSKQWDDGLIFHLSELHGLNGGWNLTLLDFASADCSA
ncbi:MAG: hypothetical protein E7B59_12870 [Enterobacteriaceae bacterium]|nr:hypothetical protein [Enterobacteriaceae bacterium]